MSAHFKYAVLRPLNSGVSLHLKESSTSAGVVGFVGLLIAAASLVLFWVLIPIMFLSLLLGVPAAGYAWSGGWRRLGVIVFVATLAPPTYLSFESNEWAFALIALGWVVTCVVVWLVVRHQQVVAQANISLQADRER
jgi:hypothetical protein